MRPQNLKMGTGMCGGLEEVLYMLSYKDFYRSEIHVTPV